MPQTEKDGKGSEIAPQGAPLSSAQQTLRFGSVRMKLLFAKRPSCGRTTREKRGPFRKTQLPPFTGEAIAALKGRAVAYIAVREASTARDLEKF